MDSKIKVYVSHYRYDGEGELRRYLRSKPNDFEPSPFGGETVVEIVDQRTGVSATGIAFCSTKDQFNYKMGRKIAFGRAMKLMTDIALR